MKKLSESEYTKFEGADKIVELDKPSNQVEHKKLGDYQVNNPQPMPKKERKEAIKRFNNNPTTKANNVIAISKRKYYYSWLFFGIIFLLMLLWFNISISNGKLSPEIINQVNTPDITNEHTISNQINNTNQHIINNNINVTLQLPDNLSIQFKNGTG